MLRGITFSPCITPACIFKINPCFVGPNDSGITWSVKREAVMYRNPEQELTLPALRPSVVINYRFVGEEGRLDLFR